MRGWKLPVLYGHVSWISCSSQPALSQGYNLWHENMNGEDCFDWLKIGNRHDRRRTWHHNILSFLDSYKIMVRRTKTLAVSLNSCCRSDAWINTSDWGKPTTAVSSHAGNGDHYALPDALMTALSNLNLDECYIPDFDSHHARAHSECSLVNLSVMPVLWTHT